MARNQQRRSGSPLPTDWRPAYVARVRAHGGLFIAAVEAGVAPRTALRHREIDPDFSAEVDEARQIYADSIEHRMVQQAEDHGNPVGYIVRLKALRPAEYIEKSAVVNLNVTAEIDSGQATELLRGMLEQARPRTIQALAEPEVKVLVSRSDAVHPVTHGDNDTRNAAE